MGARLLSSLIFFLLTIAEALTRSKAAQPFSLVKKIAAVSRGLVAIMAADVKGWQAIVQA